MTAPKDWDLVKLLSSLGLRQLRRPFLNGLMVPAGFLALSPIASDPNKPRLVALGAIMILGIISGPLRTLREKSDGSVAYLGSLPVLGSHLIFARYVVVLVSNLSTVVLAAVIDSIWPFGSTLLSPLLLGGILASGVIGGCILLGFAMRLSLADLMRKPVIAAVLVTWLVLDRFGAGIRAKAAAATTWLWASDGKELFWIAACCAAGVLLVWSFRVGSRALQPHGGRPTPRAYDALAEGCPPVQTDRAAR